MHSTQLRRNHIQGMLTGIAIGDALGYARRGLSRRQAIKIFGSGPCRYSFCRNLGVTGFNTAQTLMTAQAIVSSGTEMERFGGNFLRRLAWYAISFPTDMNSASCRTGLKYWFRWLRTPRPSTLLSNEPAVRSILLVMALHNTNLGTRNWIEHSANLTHQSPLVIDGCHILAGLTNLIINERGELNAIAAAKFLADLRWPSEYSQRLKLLVGFLEKGQRSSAVAQHFGWSDGIPSTIIPTVIMSVYCFLRHHWDFSKAVDAAIRLGGDTSSLGAIVGGLSGAILGMSKLPRNLVSDLSDKGYGLTFIDNMSLRLSEWPHGADDLLDAPALPSDPISIVRSNVYRRFRHVTHAFRRIPCKLFTNSSARVRHATIIH